MKRKIIHLFLLTSLLFLITACSANNSIEKAEDRDYAAESNEIGVANKQDYSTADSERELADNTKEISANRMIIHQAQLQIKVKNLEKARLKIENKVKEYGGYIVESNVYRESDEMVSGRMTVRVPEKDFQAFLNDTEADAADILQRNVTGQDVTEQYIDLESRIKTKRAVEKRLLEFMDGAEKTEDLLKISGDLAKVQEEIELIMGQMKYLENQTSYSTVEINMFEDRVIVPELGKKDLDTWEKTKKQLATSTNFILAAISGLIVFFIGNLPVIIILLIIGAGIYLTVKRRKKEQD